jgi:hypothetical protein
LGRGAPPPGAASCVGPAAAVAVGGGVWRRGRTRRRRTARRLRARGNSRAPAFALAVFCARLPPRPFATAIDLHGHDGGRRVHAGSRQAQHGDGGGGAQHGGGVPFSGAWRLGAGLGC